MSIATKKGDKGETSLVGGRRVSKADLRVEAYGTLDELGTMMGFARSICRHERVAEATKAIQKELFTVSASLASPEDEKKSNRVTQAMVDGLTKQVEEIEAMDGILGDWVLPFFYNIGMTGFRSSVLVWLFFGGLVSLELMFSPIDDKQTSGPRASDNVPE